MLLKLLVWYVMCSAIEEEYIWLCPVQEVRKGMISCSFYWINGPVGKSRRIIANWNEFWLSHFIFWT